MFNNYEGRVRECSNCGTVTNVFSYCEACDENICEGCDHTCRNHAAIELPEAA